MVQPQALTMLALRNPRGTCFACTARDHLLQALSIYNSAAPKKRRRHFTLRFSVRRAFVLQTTIGGRKLQQGIKV